MTFYHLDDGSAITDTTSPTDTTMDTKICNANYYEKNSVFDSSVAAADAYSADKFALVN